MKKDPVQPGKLWTIKAGRNERLVLVLAVHFAGEDVQYLDGFSGSVKPGYAVIAEALGGQWQSLGPYEQVALKSFSDEGSGYAPYKRRGPPITYMPGMAPKAVDRANQSKQSLTRAGGERKMFSLSKDALDALDYIGNVAKLSGDEKVDDTKIVNRVLVEEEKRLRRKRGEPKA